MSLILDALRKLDRERSSRQKGTTNIAVAILRPDLPRPGRRTLRYLAVVSVAAIASAAITYVVMMKSGFLARSSAPVPLLTAPASDQQVALSRHSPEPVRHAQSEKEQIAPKIEIPAESKIPVARKDHVAPLNEEKATQSVIRPTPDEPASPPPSLSLSAIAWSQEPSKRLALINDKIAREGSEILGVKVVEIHPHQVRFSYKGQTFELSLSP